MASTLGTRSRRAATLAVKPDLAESIGRINALKSRYNEGVRAEFMAVQKAFKDDCDAQIDFWLSTPELFDLGDFRHTYLLRYLFEMCGTGSSTATAFLDRVGDVTPIGLVRETYRGGATRYRIRVGFYA